MIWYAMVQVHFTSNLRRHVDNASVACSANTVRGVLEQAFLKNERLRDYVLDDQGALRKHMRILVNGRAVQDLVLQSDRVLPDDEVWVMQALSGG
jgi:sulfur-carrier protein